MKKLIFFTCFILFFIVSFSYSQTERLDYKKVDYITVENENDRDFMELVNNALTPEYQRLSDTGEIKTWRLYKVVFPGGERSGYDYVSIITAEDIDTFENNFIGKSVLYFLPGTDDDQVVSDFVSVSKLEGSEIWKVRSLIPMEEANSDPSRFKAMDYMNVSQGRGLEYLMLEDEVAMPLHEERINRNTMTGWEVYSLILPGGTEYGYNYATGNYFDTIADVEFGFTQELIKQTMPGTDVADLLETIYETRDLVKSELWELVANTN